MNEQERVRERVLVRVEVEVSTRQQRERREQAQSTQQIVPESVIDWRSYDRRTIPGRWRV